MADPAPSKRLGRALDELRSVEDPLDRLNSVRLAREALDKLETESVVQARKAGLTWGAIGALYGLTKQGAQQRFRGTSRS